MTTRWSLSGVPAERFFLVLALGFGIAMVFVTPPLSAPDEIVHYLRAYAVSEGHFVPVLKAEGAGDWLPQSVGRLPELIEGIPFHPDRKFDAAAILERLREPLQPRRRTFVLFLGAAPYTAVPYLPQAVGMAVARWFGGSALELMYAGRVANLAVITVLTVWAIRLAPFGKWILVMLSLTPMSVFLKASLSGDPLTIGASFLMLAAVLAAAFRDPADPRLLLTIVVSSVVLSSCKPTLLLLAVLIIPVSRYSRRVIVAALGVFVTMNGFVLWASARLAAKMYAPVRAGSNAILQAAFVREHPLHVLWIVFRDYQIRLSTYAMTFAGRLGWLDVVLPQWLILSCITILFLVAVVDGPSRLSDGHRLLFLLIFVGSSVLISLSQYIVYCLPGEDAMGGVQGRYWIPIAPVGYLIFTRRSGSIDFSRPRWWPFLGAFVGVTLAESAYRVLHRFYET